MLAHSNFNETDRDVNMIHSTPRLVSLLLRCRLATVIVARAADRPEERPHGADLQL